VNFWKRFLTVIRKKGAWIFALTFFFILFDQLLGDAIQADLGSMEGITWRLWVWGFLSMLLSICAPIILNLLVIYAVKPVANPFKKNLNQSLIEELRALGSVMLWSILFIIPGLIRLAQYVFVPFIVTLSQRYQDGELDALAGSRSVSGKMFLKVIGILVVFTVIFPLILTSWDEYHIFWMHPVGNLLMTAVQSVLSIMFGLILLKLWESKNESHV
jgi:hypothetical protein